MIFILNKVHVVTDFGVLHCSLCRSQLCPSIVTQMKKIILEGGSVG